MQLKMFLLHICEIWGCQITDLRVKYQCCANFLKFMRPIYHGEMSQLLFYWSHFTWDRGVKNGNHRIDLCDSWLEPELYANLFVNTGKFNYRSYSQFFSLEILPIIIGFMSLPVVTKWSAYNIGFNPYVADMWKKFI